MKPTVIRIVDDDEALTASMSVTRSPACFHSKAGRFAFIPIRRNFLLVTF